MAWKKRKKKALDGEIVEPSLWQINQSDLASEVNGYLDSDNVANHTLDASNVKRDTFTQVLMNHRFAQYGYIFTHTRAGWSNAADYIAREDGRTRWHGVGSYPIREDIWKKTFLRDSFGTSSAGSAGLYSSPKTDDGRAATVCNMITGDEYPSTYTEEDYPLLKHREEPYDPDIDRPGSYFPPFGYDDTTRMPFFKFRADVDSMLIAELSANVSWLPHLGSLNNMKRFWQHAWSLYWQRTAPPDSDGTAPIPKWDSKKRYYGLGAPYWFKDVDGPNRHTDMWILCSQFRITVDGEAVARTGYMGPELVHHPIYLTGAVPITAGEHTVQLEVRFVWYNPAKGGSKASSGGNPTYEPNEDSKPWIRVDCSVRHPNLVVQIRSR